MKDKSWTEAQLRSAAQESRSIRQILQRLGLAEAGGNYAQIKKYLHIYNINMENIKGKSWCKGLNVEGHPRVQLDQLLVENSSFQSYKLKNRLFNSGLKPRKCEECGWSKITPSGHLPLEIHHINGDRSDNRINNLVILCPNCHSQKPNYRGRRRD
ncbi:MAG: HNH endonuclease signature motif containing protein [Patescibacteria group bacterium]|jgi:hypothetical protein